MVLLFDLYCHIVCCSELMSLSQQYPGPPQVPGHPMFLQTTSMGRPALYKPIQQQPIMPVTVSYKPIQQQPIMPV